MAIVRIMQVPIDQIVSMSTMRDRFMPAPWSMYVFLSVSLAPMCRRATFRVVWGYRDFMLIDMVIMRVMQMSIMQVTNVVIVQDTFMAALRAMGMGMIFVLRQVTIVHRCSLHKKMN